MFRKAAVGLVGAALALSPAGPALAGTDLLAPVVTWTTLDPAFSPSDVFRVNFRVDDPGAAVTCAYDAAAPVPCTSGHAVKVQTNGAHKVVVVATDAAGNVSLPMTKTWKADLMRPVVRLRAPAEPFTLADSLFLVWSGSDSGGSGLGTFDVRFRSARYDGPFGEWATPRSWQRLAGRGKTLTGLEPGTTYCVAVRAVDKAGGYSHWSEQRCTARVLDDRSLGRVGKAWKKKSGVGYYAGTYSVTATRGATMRLAGATTSRLALVATRCPTCGVVGVYVDGKLVERIDLHASTTRKRAVFVLPRRALRTADVEIRVLSKGKKVQVDGLGATRG